MSTLTPQLLLRFLISGLVPGVTSWIICFLFVYFGVSTSIAGSIGYWLAVPTGYLTQRLFVFQSHTPKVPQGLRFFLVTLISGWLAGQVLNFFCQPPWSYSLTESMVLTTILLTPVNFFVMRFFVFPQRNGQRSP